MAAPNSVPKVEFPSQTKWASWLNRNHRSSTGVWLRIAKKGSGIPSVTYPEAVESALCYGWIDGLKHPENERTWLQKFTPRQPRSVWSKINRERALALIEGGRMKPAGLEQVERARKDGRWDRAYDSASSAMMHRDFQLALKRSPKAQRAFNALNRANQYGMTYRVQTAKKPETRVGGLPSSSTCCCETKSFIPEMARDHLASADRPSGASTPGSALPGNDSHCPTGRFSPPHGGFSPCSTGKSRPGCSSWPPPGTELDILHARPIISLVGFRFEDVRIGGLSVPSHRAFDEVNLRFYVRRRLADGTWRRGVVFIKEIVPLPAVAAVARLVYGEPYVSLPMRHDITATQAGDDSFGVCYAWRFGKRWQSISGRAAGHPSVVEPGSEEEFVTDHHWGYRARTDGRTNEYRVEHPRWAVWRLGSPRADCDVAELYGAAFAGPLAAPPRSAFLAQGSKVAVYRRILPAR